MIAAGGLGGATEVSPATLAALVLLFAASFFFSGTETALFSLQKVDRTWLARQGRTGAQVVRMLSRPQRTIATILMGNESANVAITATVGGLVATLAPTATWITVFIVTPLLVLVSEITPKVLAFRFNRTWSQLAAWPLWSFYFLVSPIRAVFSVLVSALARPFGATPRTDSEGLAEEELRVLVDHGAAAGELHPLERDIIEAVLVFDEQTVDRLMTPRPDMFGISVHMPWGELLKQANARGFSRIPVYAGRTDDIVGVLLLKDLLKHRRSPPAGPRQLRSLLLPPSFVPASKSADTMLSEFLERRIHMAFVVDEHGTLVGLVTLHDLLGELLGELESVTEDSEISELSPFALTVKGSMDIDDFTEESGIEVPAGDYHTIGGYVFHEVGRLPRPGDKVVVDGHTFRVSSMDGRRIVEVTVTRPGMPAAPEEATG